MQTAVEWLHDKWSNCKEWKWEEIEQWFEQAKEMEKEQIIKAWMVIDNELQRIVAEQYYNETYKSQLV